MVAHKKAEGNSLHPTDHMKLLSGQTELPTMSLWRCAHCTQVWQFRLTLGPLQCLQRMLHYCMSPVPGMECLSIYLLNTGVKHLQKFPDFSLTSQNSLTVPSLEKVFLIFQIFQSEWEPCIYVPVHANKYNTCQLYQKGQMYCVSVKIW